jgi:RNA polymerase sigma-70 factor (ECF subfamily)
MFFIVWRQAFPLLPEKIQLKNMSGLYTAPEAFIIKKCIEGDRKSQKKLYDLYFAKMRSSCFRFTKNPLDVEDILQDGFVKLFRNLHTYRGEGPLEGWIRRIFVNVAIEHLKRKKLKTVELSGLENHVVEKNITVLDILYEKDLLKMSQTISNGYRTVFKLYAIDGYTHKEIGDKLGIAESTSKSQYTRAKVKLQQLVGENGRQTAFFVQ